MIGSKAFAGRWLAQRATGRLRRVSPNATKISPLWLKFVVARSTGILNLEFLTADGRGWTLIIGDFRSVRDSSAGVGLQKAVNSSKSVSICVHLRFDFLKS
jgi:hypothetical protein